MTLLLSNPTIDYIAQANQTVFTNRVGGPPLYTRLIHKKIGDKLTILGGIDYNDYYLFKNFIEKASGNLEVKLLHTKCTQKHYLFYLKNNHRKIYTIKKCPIPSFKQIYKDLISTRPDEQIIINPTTITEDSVDSIIKVTCLFNKVSMDFQSISRESEFAHKIMKQLLEHEVYVIHAEHDEFINLSNVMNMTPMDFITKLKTKHLLVSKGGEPLVYCRKKECIKIQPSISIKAGDTTGAGDILLYTFVFFSKQLDAIEAARKSVATATLHVLKQNGFINKITSTLIEKHYQKTNVFEENSTINKID